MSYDANNRPVTQKLSGGGTAYALTQLSYDALGRPDCTAVRMNPAVYGSLPASACTLGTQGSHGPDRIAQTIYDAAGQVIQNKVAVGTADAATERTLTYTANAMLATLKDAEDNFTTWEYDGHDRLAKTRFPVTTQGANQSSTTDFEELTYDANGNVTSRVPRGGSAANPFNYVYDKLNRLTAKGPPNPEPTTTYAYDNLGRLTSASQTGHALSFTYDALSRNLTQAGPQGTVSSQWDAAGRRTRLTYPGSGLYVDYDRLVTGEVTKIRENGATSGVGVLATFGYDDLGRRTLLLRGNGRRTIYEYDPVSRLAALVNTSFGSASDVRFEYTRNPAGQIGTRWASNDAYAWTGHGSGSTASVADGLNRLATIGGAATAHDARGNLTSDPATGKTYGYSSENLLTSASGGATLGYDPAMRLHQVAGAATVRFAYDGLDMIAEYDGANALQRRYVHGPAIDEPLVQYEGSGTGDRRFLEADERGSVVLVADSSGATLTTNRYDEYGKPQGTNAGRFQYTGQMWIGELGLYHYKARAYAPHLGRFLQPDPIGYWDSPNLYAYVHNDPVNFVDPLGLQDEVDEEILVRAWKIEPGRPSFEAIAAPTFALAGLQQRASLVNVPNPDEEIVVVCDATCRAKKKAKPKVVTPSLDPFTFWKHFRHDEGETICLTHDQFYRVVELAKPQGSPNPNGANLVSYYGTPLENTFGSATLFMSGGKPVGFYDLYDFNIGGGRGLKGEVKTVVGAVLGAGAEPFETRYPC